MNREQMIEVAIDALFALWWSDPEAIPEREDARNDAVAVVDALVAAGCVPSDALTDDARVVDMTGALELYVNTPGDRLCALVLRDVQINGLDCHEGDDIAFTLTTIHRVARGVSATPEARTRIIGAQALADGALYERDDPRPYEQRMTMTQKDLSVRAVTPDERNEP